MLKELGNAQKLRIGGLTQLSVRVKPSQKARKGRNPGNQQGEHERPQASESARVR
jgi:hypothetical protein